MDYPKFIVSNQKEESINKQWVKLETLFTVKDDNVVLVNIYKWLAIISFMTKEGSPWATMTMMITDTWFNSFVISTDQ